MTRARALKQVIRARAAKTGERYTAARRHILREIDDDKPSASALSATADKKGLSPQGLSPQAAEASPLATTQSPSPAATKGGLSDAKAIEKTGHDLAHWFGVLDRFGGIEKGHTASTALLYEKYEVPGWYCQGIVVAYERARGKRVMNQRCDGAFEVSVSKVIGAKTPALVKAFEDAKKRKEWSIDADAGLVKALETGLKDPKSKGFITRPDGQARFRFRWDATTVQFNLYPKGPGKTSIVAQQMKLRDAGEVERYRKLWKTAFAALASAVSTAS
jgi:hypothetical protein